MLKDYKICAKNILELAFPIIMGNLGFIMIGVGDVIVAGRHSTDTLAAISLATAMLNCILMLGIGILSTISAILSNYRGEGKDIRKYFFPSVKFSLFLGLLSSIIILIFIPIIDKIGFAPNLAKIVKDYFFITAFATFGGYLHCAVKEYLQAFEIVIFPNILTIFCVFLNLFLNIIFVFGWEFIPQMGAIGLAIASLVVRYFMGFGLLVYCLMKIKVQYYKDFNYFKDLIKVGLPSSLAIMIEFVGFNIISVVMGRVAGIYAAAHNILCTMSSVSFMVPLAISNAVSVKVGFTNGSKEFALLKKYAHTGIGMSLIFMSFSAIIFGLFPEFLVSLFTRDYELVKVCVPIVYTLCFFQLFDGLQVSLSGIFRGLKRTKIVMISNLIAYWIISFPLGCVLAFKLNLNLIGFWYGLFASSIIVCSIMSLYLKRIFKKLD
ncbi:MAG: MATE family efflux transporter [bacterium]|nr:MATE family efflux transporter [bacterium]